MRLFSYTDRNLPKLFQCIFSFTPNPSLMRAVAVIVYHTALFRKLISQRIGNFPATSCHQPREPAVMG